MAKKYSKTVDVNLETMKHEITEESVIQTENDVKGEIAKEDHPDFLDKEFNIHAEESPTEMEKTGPETINGIITGTIINSVHVRVRREPNIKSDVIELLRRGDHVNILNMGNVGGFYKVETFTNNIGYILMDFVKEE